MRATLTIAVICLVLASAATLFHFLPIATRPMPLWSGFTIRFSESMVVLQRPRQAPIVFLNDQICLIAALVVAVTFMVMRVLGRRAGSR